MMKGLDRYQWRVFIAATVAWLFSTMVQRLFVLARGPALRALLPPEATAADVTWYSGVATGIFMVGWAAGGLFFGVLADRWGRARTMLLTVVLYSVFTGLSALAVGWWDFAFYRLLAGLGVGGEFAAGATLVAEALPDRARPRALGLLQAFSAVGNILASASSMVLLSIGWRWLFLVGLAPLALVAATFRTLHEPEAWVKLKATGGAARKMGSLGDLFRIPRWRRSTIIGLTLAVSGVVGLWGIGFWTPELIREALAGASPEVRNRYVSVGTILQDVGAFCGLYLFARLASHMGRRPAFILSYLLGLGGTVLTFGWLSRPSDIFWMLPILGFCNLMVFGGFSIYFPELYPTRLRSSGVGVCYNVGRVVAALGPFTFGGLTVLLADMGISSPFRMAAIALASVYLVGVVAMLFAPETRGKPLPEE